ncbi:sugar phosphate isomerase/epimerase [Actinokineospora sp. UTMC 2448]|uniref:sugar phosphate isomerase/epimerase family protein n=1 Tax=Actinokineospora sp. UTMC 2448 TaxID=2268449 RepID=UPI002164E47F|nr:sugar phosphate isomerase/epimerase [Actinokineospora sp. UTMC 2448]UVS81963.1 Xylose isomerase-like TIM barrel [Actinokineospora sp. UTMC 2448]
MTTRRTFLRGAAASAATVGIGAVGVGAALPGIASAHSGRSGRVPRNAISIQLYTLRGIMGDDPEPVLSALADIGYRRVEMAGLYGRSAEEMARMLRRHHLHATSTHTGLDGDLDQVIADARTLGHRYVVVPWANYSTIAQWESFADRLENAGKVLRRAGFKAGYHNHAHEFALIEGKRPFDVIASRTTARNVHFELDLYWAVVGGVDPVAFFRQHHPRVRQYHVKDRAADGGFADLGTGNIDFARIFTSTAVEEYIVENDQPADALVTAQVGYDYLRNLRW